MHWGSHLKQFRMKLSDRDKNVRDRLLASLNSEKIDDLFSIYREEDFRHLAIPILAEKANYGHQQLQQIMALDQVTFSAFWHEKTFSRSTI